MNLEAAKSTSSKIGTTDCSNGRGTAASRVLYANWKSLGNGWEVRGQVFRFLISLIFSAFSSLSMTRLIFPRSLRLVLNVRFGHEKGRVP